MRQAPVRKPRLNLDRGQVPLPAQRTLVSFSLSGHAHHERRVERVALGAVATLAHAHAAPLVVQRFFHAPGPLSFSASRRIFASTTNGPAGNTLATITSAVRRHGQSCSKAACSAAAT